MTHRSQGSGSYGQNNRDQKIDDVNRSLLEQENDRKWAQLGNDVEMLKMVWLWMLSGNINRITAADNGNQHRSEIAKQFAGWNGTRGALMGIVDLLICRGCRSTVRTSSSGRQLENLDKCYPLVLQSTWFIWYVSLSLCSLWFTISWENEPPIVYPFTIKYKSTTMEHSS